MRLKVQQSGFKTYKLYLLVVVTLFIQACATPRTAQQQTPGSCDPAIDEAVLKGDWEKALQDHQRYLAGTPGDCLAIYHLGFIWGRMGDRSREVQFYQEAVRCGYDRDDRIFFNMGMAMASMGDLHGAQGAFEKAISVNPGNADNYFGLGLIDQAMGQDDQAEVAWLKAVALDGHHIEAHLALARLFLDQSRWGEARDHLDRVLADDPDNEEVQGLKEILRSRQFLEY